MKINFIHHCRHFNTVAFAFLLQLMDDMEAQLDEMRNNHNDLKCCFFSARSLMHCYDAISV